jgi:hypothetical protein
MGNWCEMVLSTDQIEDDIQFRNTDRTHGQAVEGEGWKKPKHLIAQYRFEEIGCLCLRREFPTMVSSSSLPML